MTKKDIIIFLHMFLQAYKMHFSKRVLFDLRDDVYRTVKKCKGFFDFKLEFLADGLGLPEHDWNARKQFCKYLNDVYSIVKY